MGRSKTPSFVLSLPLKTEKWQEDQIDHEFDRYRRVYNCCINELYKRYNTMRQSKAYQANCKYKGEDRNKRFGALSEQFGLTEFSLHSFVTTQKSYFGLNINIAQKIATRAFAAFQKLMFHKAEKIKYKPFGTLDSVEGKDNKTGIIYRNGFLNFIGLKLPLILKSSDTYAQLAIQSRIKFCQIMIKEINGKKRYYVNIVLEGLPPQKVEKKELPPGKVGIDIGTQTLACSSQYQVKLVELSPKINDIDRQVKILQRKMDRSKRATNPNKYNENGTINTQNKDKWVFSNHYRKHKAERKELFRKQTAIRKQCHYELINELLTLGDTFQVETMNFKSLQKRSKKISKNKNGRIKSKKRFGRSLANKAPGMFLEMLSRKLARFGTQLMKIDTAKVKASQYDHTTGKYVKKTLSQRWHDFGDFSIQRDLYSSFLIMNVSSDLKTIEREACFETFDRFRILHDEEVVRIATSDSKKIKSMGF